MTDSPTTVAVAVAEAVKRAEELLGDEHERRARVLAATERAVQALLDDARGRALAEAAVIVEAAKAEAAMESVRAREALRAQVAAIAVKGAEAILKREVNPQNHKELLERLAQELKSRGDA
jgi:F-type H+-transporting ATPase subunit b